MAEAERIPISDARRITGLCERTLQSLSGTGVLSVDRLRRAREQKLKGCYRHGGVVTNADTLAAVSGFVYSPEMAGNCKIGQVAEWFKAAVLKTAKGKPPKSAETAHFRRSCIRNSRKTSLFAHRVSSRSSAQFVYGSFSTPYPGSAQ